MGDVRDVYAPLAQSLSEAGFRVVTADLRGHGDSSATFTAYGDEATASDLIALIEALDAGSAVVVGASMSGAAAVIAAGRRPDLVTGVVLEDPARFGTRSPRELLARGAARERARAAEVADLPAAVGRALETMPPSCPVPAP